MSTWRVTYNMSLFFNTLIMHLIVYNYPGNLDSDLFKIN